MYKLRKQEDVARSYQRFVLFGLGGLGKTTAFANISNKAIVFDLDRRWPKDKVSKHDFLDLTGDYPNLLESLDGLIAEKSLPHDWVVVDTLTLVFRAIESHTIQNDCKGDGELYHAYGHGLKFTPGYLNKVLEKLDMLGTKHGCNIGLISHATPKTYKNPLGADYSKVCLDLPDKVANVVVQWADYVGYVYDEVYTTTSNRVTKAAGKARYIAFSDNPAHEGKNSSPHKLPAKILFDEQSEWAKIVLGSATGSLLKEAEDLVDTLKMDPEKAKVIEAVDIYSMAPADLATFVQEGKQFLKKGGKK